MHPPVAPPIDDPANLTRTARQWAGMPWCTECDRFLSPPSVAADGTCPTCGRTVDPGRARVATDHSTPPPAVADDEELPPIPWHLKALAAAVALYLGFRAWQGVEWVAQRLGG